MAEKIAGRLNPPPSQAEFDAIPLAGLCSYVSGAAYRLHATNPETGAAWPPVHFSRRGGSRFDPSAGIGTLCLGETFAGALMELFNDHWGPVGSFGRRVTEQTLSSTWVSLVRMPRVCLFDATGPNLSKIGTDAQLLTGEYAVTQQWALRLMQHPAAVDGILYRSRHDPQRVNAALFGRSWLTEGVRRDKLKAVGWRRWERDTKRKGTISHDAAMLLRDHPELKGALVELQVARLP